MLYDLRSLGKLLERLELTYLIADTDRGSLAQVEAFHEEIGAPSPRVLRVPRAREVGQIYISSIFTTLRAAWFTFQHVWQLKPDIVLTNGPGTCVPVVLAGYICRALGVCRSLTIYSESFARSENLSLSGRILYHVVDRFTVQWEELLPLHPRAKYAGFHSRPGADEDLPPLPEPATEGPATAIVTVGSTRFDELIRTVDSQAFLDALRTIGIRRLVVQKGNGTYQPTAIVGAGGDVEVQVIEYSPSLPADIRRAALVISHAGAGTIMDCLLSACRLVVVPNEALMNNHQIQLGMALQDQQLLFCFTASKLLEGLQKADFASLRRFPDAPSPVFPRCVRELLDGAVPGPS